MFGIRLLCIWMLSLVILILRSTPYCICKNNLDICWWVNEKRKKVSTITRLQRKADWKGIRYQQTRWDALVLQMAKTPAQYSTAPKFWTGTVVTTDHNVSEHSIPDLYTKRKVNFIVWISCHNNHLKNLNSYSAKFDYRLSQKWRLWWESLVM